MRLVLGLTVWVSVAAAASGEIVAGGLDPWIAGVSALGVMSLLLNHAHR